MKQKTNTFFAREIRFRLWDGYKIIKNPQMRVMCGNLNKAIRCCQLQSSLRNKDKVSILMQYTGLKDKNDVEIYEGDIIEYEEMQSDNIVYPNHERKVVKYQDSYFATIDLDLKFWKVIGNIYENVELL